jgi:GNAT superfamily N-acetyltransferase
LRSPSREALELNEAYWWSNWAHIVWLGSSGYLLTSESFRETFFNRACILNCRGVDATVAWAEGRLMGYDTVSTVTIFDSCTKTARGLQASGYRPVDTMTVLLSSRPAKPASSVQVTISERPAPDSWTRAYLEAFYGDQELAPHVTPIVARLRTLNAVTLLEAMVGDETAGVLAIFRTEDLAGVYCVGTIPEHRRKGVAGSLLSRAKDITGAEGRHLFLQSLASDVTTRYYLQRGFRVLYSKQLLSKGETSNANKKESV